MKISKLPGFGSYGVTVTDFDWSDPDSYKELKKINLMSLVTIVKGTGTDNFKSVADNISNIINVRINGSRWALKYGANWKNMLTDIEKQMLSVTSNWPVDIVNAPGWVRVTGEKTKDNMSTGLFGETELLWHTDETAVSTFAPVVALYGQRNMSTSATCFMQTADWYEAQSASFQSELDELISIFQYTNQLVQPNSDRIHEYIIRDNLVPIDGTELPLVIKSPSGIKGLSWSTLITGFKGVSNTDATRLIEKINKELFCSEYTYDYWWDYDKGDLVLFDQSLTMHCRKIKQNLNLQKELVLRLAYRITGDYTDINYNPYYQEYYRNLRADKFKNLYTPEILKTLTPNWQKYVKEYVE